MPKGKQGFQKGNKINLGRKRPPFSAIWKKRMGDSRRGENNPAFGKHYPDSGFKKGHKDFVPLESRKRQAKKISGDKHYNWISDRSSLAYPTGWADDLKESIRKRDGYTCQLCGIHQDELSYELHCHHIDYDKDNLDPQNLISLCMACHCRTNFNREYWTQYFQEFDKV